MYKYINDKNQEKCAKKKQEDLEKVMELILHQIEHPLLVDDIFVIVPPHMSQQCRL